MYEEPLIEGHLFGLGNVVLSNRASDELTTLIVEEALQRHVTGVWEHLDEESLKQNHLGAEARGCVLSVHEPKGFSRFWVKTEAGHFTTTLFFTEEY